MFATPVTVNAFVTTVATGLSTLGLDNILLAMIGLGATIGLIWRKVKPRGA